MSWYDITIENAGFSDPFKQTLIREGFVSMRELLKMPVAELMQKEWFTIEMLEELQLFTRKHKKA